VGACHKTHENVQLECGGRPEAEVRGGVPTPSFTCESVDEPDLSLTLRAFIDAAVVPLLVTRLLAEMGDENGTNQARTTLRSHVLTVPMREEHGGLDPHC
jgi:hypothetical protein